MTIKNLFWQRNRLICHLPAALLFFGTALIFSMACFNGFIEAYDDELYITFNQVVQRGLTFEGISWAFTTFHAGNWHPLTWLSHMTDVEIFGLNPAGHHLVSVLLHATSSLLLFHFLMLLGIKSRISLLAAAFFAIHPLRVESVVWVAERKDVLSFCFGLAALLAYVHNVRYPAPRRYLLVLLLFMLALMSKPMLVTLPLLLLLLDVYHFRRFSLPGADRFRILLEKVPFLIISVVIAWVTVVAQKSENALSGAPVGERAAVAISAYLEYLRMFFLPIGLSFHYPLKPDMIGNGRVVLSLLVLVAISAWIYRTHGSSIERFGWCWFLITLVPVSGILRFGGQFVADRYTYLPHVGLVLILSAIVTRGAGGKGEKTGRLMLVAAVLLFSVLTVRQAGYWHDGNSLYRRAITVDPENWLAHNNLATVLFRKDQYGEGFMELAYGLMLRGRQAEAMQTLAFAYKAGGVPFKDLDDLRGEINKRMATAPVREHALAP